MNIETEEVGTEIPAQPEPIVPVDMTNVYNECASDAESIMRRMPRVAVS